MGKVPGKRNSIIQKKKHKKIGKRIKTERKEVKGRLQIMQHAQGEKKAKDSNMHKGRSYTVSVALPGSILDNAQSPELRTYLAGQIARALVIFEVDEVVVFDEHGNTVNDEVGEFKGVTKKGNDPSKVLANILQYLECPQYLRKFFFPKHPDLKYAGLLNPLNATHHVLIDEDVPYREGVVVDRPTGSKGSLVNCGMRKEVRIDRQLQAGLRVTVKLDTMQTPTSKLFNGIVVSPDSPKIESGLYWGYRVRIAGSLGAVIAECPYEGGYDLSVGTSDNGSPVEEMEMTPFRHLLVAFGGLSGLEAALESDESLSIPDIRLFFDHYVNTCVRQGSRTIRTEEAMLISLTALRPKIFAMAE